MSIEARKGLSSRLERSIKLSLEESKNSLTGLSARLDALSPFKVLARGYSITFRKVDGSVVRESKTVVSGDEIRTLVSDGEIISRVITSDLIPINREILRK